MTMGKFCYHLIVILISRYYIHGPELMKLIFAVLDVCHSQWALHVVIKHKVFYIYQYNKMKYCSLRCTSSCKSISGCDTTTKQSRSSHDHSVSLPVNASSTRSDCSCSCAKPSTTAARIDTSVEASHWLKHL